MDFEGMELEVFADVYEPAEDSLLLAKYAKKLQGRILDMGCGCGIVSLACAKFHPASEVVGADINPNAVENSEFNAAKNGIINAVFLESDLFSKVKGRFDAIVLNPPYLPTSRKERLEGQLNHAFDGGISGRKTTDRFLGAFPKFLKKSGTLLLIGSSLAGIEKTVKKLGTAGFQVKILEEERFFFEKIAVLDARRL